MPFSPLTLIQRVKISLPSHGKAGSGLLMLPQGYLHSPTTCHRLVAEDLSKWPWPAEVLLFHYIDDILLTSNSLAELEKAVTSVVPFEVMWLGSQRNQAARAWIVCQSLGGCLIR